MKMSIDEDVNQCLKIDPGVLNAVAETSESHPPPVEGCCRDTCNNNSELSPPVLSLLLRVSSTAVVNDLTSNAKSALNFSLLFNEAAKVSTSFFNNVHLLLYESLLCWCCRFKEANVSDLSSWSNAARLAVVSMSLIRVRNVLNFSNVTDVVQREN